MRIERDIEGRRFLSVWTRTGTHWRLWCAMPLAKPYRRFQCGFWAFGVGPFKGMYFPVAE